MKLHLHSYKITSRRAATAVAVAASVYFSFSALHNQKVRQQRDLETSASLLADGLREALEPILDGPRSHLQELADHFGKRGHLAGIAVFAEDRSLLARSKSLPQSLVKPPSIVARAALTRRGAEGYELTAGRRLRVNAVPLEVKGKPAGVVAVFHDPAFIEARMERTRWDSAWRMLLQGGVFLVAVWLFGLFIKE
ncbi:MAG: hypothetical protein HY077_03515 [Elusimicrobia bacterium]|nr:hypothetical protein [Elusimicrobiota bacterium]